MVLEADKQDILRAAAENLDVGGITMGVLEAILEGGDCVGVGCDVGLTIAAYSDSILLKSISDHSSSVMSIIEVCVCL